MAWSLALPLATLASSGAHASSGVYLLSLGMYLAGGVLCHQLPARSFFLWGSQMPVCARCTGIYVGGAAAAILATLRTFRKARPNLAQASGSGKLALVAASLPSLATLAYEWTTGQTPANWIRAAAGVPIGAVVAWIVCHARPDDVDG